MSKMDDGDLGPEDVDWRVVKQREYDPDGSTGLTTVVVAAVAAAEGVDVVEVKSPPLYEVVDAAAIADGLFGSRTPTKGDGPTGAAVFTYRDHRITVRSDGWVQVADRVRESSRGD